MNLKLFLFASLSFVFVKGEDLVLLAQTQTTPLTKYVRYIDCVILHFQVPLDISFASFKFEAEEIQLSLFGCKPQNISVYLKHGSPPVINPDGSKFPEDFFNISRPMEHIEFISQSEPSYINVSSPIGGSYFAAAFISYTDPRLEGIKQKGLTASCDTILTTTLLVNKQPKPIIVVPDVDNDVLLSTNTARIYKFYVFDVVDSTTLFLKNMVFCDSCFELTVRIQSNKVPLKEFLYKVSLKKKDYINKTYMIRIGTIEESWYYVSFFMKATSQQDTRFQFKVQYSFPEEDKSRNLIANSSVNLNNVILYKRSSFKQYQTMYLENVNYTQYDLLRKGYTESFIYSFDFDFNNDDNAPPIPINMTNKDLIVLKFHITPGVDIGGTLRFGIAFKPNVRRDGNIIKVDEPKHYTVLACLRNKDKEIPIWPNKCRYLGTEHDAALILNDTLKNNTLLLPYPEAGNWYASLKLFCGECKPCRCSKSCKEQFRTCYYGCETGCTDLESCNSCIDKCEKEIISKSECSRCNCEGPCQKSSETCKTSLLFEISSYPCVTGQCGVHGDCLFMLAEGFSYSICFCKDKYKGWDCTDNSSANSRAMILLEMALLVFSNLAFLPATYIAYKRRYYVEAIVYFSTFFFSSVYHACDAGDHIYTICLTRTSVLQFSDFFSGLLSIWVTLIAIAYLSPPFPSMCHIGGAIILAFVTTFDKTALWAFILPFATGTLIFVVSWRMHRKKIGKRFPSDYYLFQLMPAGIAVVTLGLLIFGLLQTQGNYMYLHSLWHVCMAVSIMLLLPDSNFLPPVALANDETLPHNDLQPQRAASSHTRIAVPSRTEVVPNATGD